MAEPLTPAGLIKVLQAERRQRWQRGDRVLAEEFFLRYPALRAHPAYALEIVNQEKLLRHELGEEPRLEEYLHRFPEFASQLRALFAVDSQIDRHEVSLDTFPTGGRAHGVTPAGGDDDLAPPPHVPGYEILGRLGQGGMGVVYKACQLRPHRLVALKMIRGGARTREADLPRFRAEAQWHSHLRHPNIVTVYEIGEVAGCPYFTLEYVAGGRLDHLLAGKPQPPRQAAWLIGTLAEAVHYVHQCGLVHRDLKPANVLVEGGLGPAAVQAPPSVVKITDFGLAKRMADDGDEEPGDIVGTPCYMAPEQANGQTQAVGPPADVYALGVILYEMLTGRRPFVAESALDALWMAQSQPPASPRQWEPTVPPALEAVCLTCLAKEPGQRYPTAEALAADLRRFLGQWPARPARFR